MAEEVKKSLMTKSGYDKLVEELRELKEEKRLDIAQKIKIAREQGDLSENAEYDAAKDEQRDIEARIEELDNLLRNVEIVAETNNRKVNVGCTILVRNMELKKDMTFIMVGSQEANSLEGKISNESPVGSALMGAKVGDIVKVSTPAGDTRFKIKKISVTK